CSPIAVPRDGYRCRLEQAHPVLLGPPVPGVAPAQDAHARLRVFVAKPAQHSPPGEGGEIREGLCRSPMTVVVRPPAQHKVDSVQQGGEVLVRRSARRVAYLDLDRCESGAGRIGVHEALRGASLLVALDMHPQEVEAWSMWTILVFSSERCSPIGSST